MDATQILPRIRELFAGMPATRDLYGRKEILGHFSEPGCAFCREERRTVGRFFFWYLHEGYAQPENLERMQDSHGFCPRHAGTLLAEGAPHNVASVYAPLVSAAAESLRDVEEKHRSGQELEQMATALTPAGSCLACEGRRKATGHLAFLMRETLDDVEVRKALGESPAICLPHFLCVAGSLHWDKLRFVLDRIVDSLRAPAVPGDALMGVLWGAGHDGPRRTDGDTRGEDGEVPSPGERIEAPWSPAAARLRRLVAGRGCPVCRARRYLLERYLGWLSGEVRDRPYYAWSTALHLCPEHARWFARRADGRALTRLTDAARDRWLADLNRLGYALREKPPELLALRLASVPRRVRESAVSGEERRTLRAVVWEELREALRPPGRVLSRLLEPVIRPYPCPACAGLETAEDRTCDLLVRGLGDPGTLRLYQESDGLCFRHLPRVLGSCGDPAVAASLLQTQRTRMELLRWELQEYGRKQSWTVRYEPKEEEQGAWRRAVSQYSGV